jgi:ArsR family transcriptional regulator
MTTTAAAGLERAVELFHALSDETRLAIVRKLQSGEQCVCHLTDMLDAEQSRLSFHLRVLKDAGLVHDRREGRWIHYHLNRDAFAELEEVLVDLKPATRRLTVREVSCC